MRRHRRASQGISEPVRSGSFQVGDPGVHFGFSPTDRLASWRNLQGAWEFSSPDETVERRLGQRGVLQDLLGSQQGRLQLGWNAVRCPLGRKSLAWRCRWLDASRFRRRRRGREGDRNCPGRRRGRRWSRCDGPRRARLQALGRRRGRGRRRGETPERIFPAFGRLGVQRGSGGVSGLHHDLVAWDSWWRGKKPGRGSRAIPGQVSVGWFFH